ncbi:MAG: helix-turn-helix transcriptional regulator [Defluviitaleaceae bacterium]|nr:helix-turn-helix transcriptional regulator [Defluviitaleaceae bacterium]
MIHGKPHIGELIRELRDIKMMSQEAVAQAAYISRSSLSQIELGIAGCPDSLLLAIKTGMGLENLPLLDTERAAFRDKLYRWHDIINERKLDEAKELREQLSVIQLLRRDTELNTLFSMFDCKLLLGLDELEAAKKILNKFKVDGLSDMQLYHYYYNQGTYNIKCKHNQDALDFYLKAYELVTRGLEKNITLYYNIAIAYSRLGFIAKATTFLEEAYSLHLAGHENDNVSEFDIYNLLGVFYAAIGVLQRGKYFLDKAHTIAINHFNSKETDGTKTNLGLVLLNYGILFRMGRKGDEAIEHFNKAHKYFSIGNVHYLETLYQKIRTMIEMNNPFPCPTLITEGIKLSKNNEIYTLMFETLRVLANPDDESTRHVENETLPYLHENKFVRLALDYAKFLRDYYKRKGERFKTRAFKMSDTVCTIMDLIYEGGVII